MSIVEQWQGETRTYTCDGEGVTFPFKLRHRLSGKRAKRAAFYVRMRRERYWAQFMRVDEDDMLLRALGAP